jgi:hypothetical protein
LTKIFILCSNYNYCCQLSENSLKYLKTDHAINYFPKKLYLNGKKKFAEELYRDLATVTIAPSIVYIPMTCTVALTKNRKINVFTVTLCLKLKP